MDKPAPIVLFVYNRPEHTRTTLEYLSKNKLADSSRLFVFSDGPKGEEDNKKVLEVRKSVETANGFADVEVIKREENLGLAKSVIQGIDQVFEKYDKVIVLEDDVITAPLFLSFSNSALEYYKDDKKIFSVSGYPYPIRIPESYSYDVFISYRASSWGWATWKDRWEKVDWDVKDFGDFISNKDARRLFNKAGEDLTPMLIAQMNGEVDSWAIRWTYAHFRNDAYCLYPTVPLCKNIGTDRSGTHSSSSKKLDVKLDLSDKEFKMMKNLDLNKEIMWEVQKLFNLNPVRKMINLFKFYVK